LPQGKGYSQLEELLAVALRDFEGNKEDAKRGVKKRKYFYLLS
jgi:hypothetical protein